MLRFAIPESLLFILPSSIGILAGKYVNRVLNFCLMLTVYQLALVFLAFGASGVFRPQLLIPTVFIWPPLSLGQFIPPLVFLLFAQLAHGFRFSLNEEERTRNRQDR